MTVEVALPNYTETTRVVTIVSVYGIPVKTEDMVTTTLRPVSPYCIVTEHPCKD